MPESRTVEERKVSKERFTQLRELVEKAAQGKKTFTVLGRYPAIRDALRSRGWIQNVDLHRLTPVRQRQAHDDVRAATRGEGEEERQVLSRLLRHVPVSFVWALSEAIDWNNIDKSTIVSRFPRVFFTTKIGIASYLGESHWHQSAEIGARFPRCYVLSGSEDLASFIADFRVTACVGLLTDLVGRVKAQEPGLFHPDGKVPLRVVEFAVKRVCEEVSSRQHEDIDAEREKVWDHQWDQFLTHYYQAVRQRHPYQPASSQQLQEIYSCAKMAVESVTPHWPQLAMDGTHNLWIVKPGAKSRGRGIQVISRLEELQARVGDFPPNQPSLVVQKYIERPLLIYNTKFDIRQWFLVTSIYPLTIWMYKECYLRFCSHLFSLSNMHESVHLSNNAIQCKYKNEKKRDKMLPDENMWDSLTFQAYLRTIGEQEQWEKTIVPGMKGAFTCALLAAQEHVPARANTFELYGVDYMLTEDFEPWLIEINSSPCMSPTTSVTARLCPQCLEDLVKVVIDRRQDREADTGQFELAYKQEVSNPPPYTGMNLTVRGTRLRTASAGRASCGREEARPGSGQPAMREAVRRLTEQLGQHQPLSTGRRSDESGRQEPGRRRTKRHCCSGRASLSQAVHRYRASQVRPEAVRRRVSSSPAVDQLVDWRKRVERTKLDCKTTLMAFPSSASLTPRMKEGPRREDERLAEAAQEDEEVRPAAKLPVIKKKDLNNNEEAISTSTGQLSSPPHKPLPKAVPVS